MQKSLDQLFTSPSTSSSSSFFLLLLFISSPPRVEGGRWKKLGRGFRHPLAPRLRKLAAAAIGVRGDWGRKGIGSWIRDEKKRFEKPPRHPLPDQLRLTLSLSPAFLSARLHQTVRSQPTNGKPNVTNIRVLSYVFFLSISIYLSIYLYFFF